MRFRLRFLRTKKREGKFIPRYYKVSWGPRAEDWVENGGVQDNATPKYITLAYCVC